MSHRQIGDGHAWPQARLPQARALLPIRASRPWKYASVRFARRVRLPLYCEGRILCEAFTMHLAPEQFDQRDVDDIPMPEWMGVGGSPREIKWPGSFISAGGAWTEVGTGFSLRSVWLARVTGMHPIFGLRREFVALRRVESSDEGRILAVFRGIEDGLYEFRNFGARQAADKAASGFFILDQAHGIAILDRTTAYEIAEMFAAARDTLNTGKAEPCRCQVG